MNGGMHRNGVARGRSSSFRRFLAAVPIALALSSCNSWRTVGRYEGWTLYGEEGQEVETARYEAAIGPAKSAVEEILGPP